MNDDERTKLNEEVRTLHQRINQRIAALQETLPRYPSFREQFTHATVNTNDLVKLLPEFSSKIELLAGSYPSSQSTAPRGGGSDKGK